jgi:hypothetical protein
MNKLTKFQQQLLDAAYDMCDAHTISTHGGQHDDVGKLKDRFIELVERAVDKAVCLCCDDPNCKPQGSCTGL